MVLLIHRKKVRELFAVYVFELFMSACKADSVEQFALKMKEI